jgi:hypothetical protein
MSCNGQVSVSQLHVFTALTELWDTMYAPAAPNNTRALEQQTHPQGVVGCSLSHKRSIRIVFQACRRALHIHPESFRALQPLV